MFLSRVVCLTGALIALVTSSMPHPAPSCDSHLAAKRQDDGSRRSNTKFGIGYEVWWNTIVQWTSNEAEPVLGHYSSLNESVIKQHAEWIGGAGIDFVLADLSNLITEEALTGLDALFATYATLDTHPEIAILLSTFENGTAAEKFQLVQDRYLSNSTYASMFVQYQGKPLLTFYTGASYTPPPAEYNSNDNFTIRFLSAFQEIVLNNFGAWAWVNREPILDGTTMNISSFESTGLDGWTADPTWRIAALGDAMYATSQVEGNGTQAAGNLTSPSFTINAGVVQFNAIGTDFSAQAGTNMIASRNIYLLKDADTGEIYRSSAPPGSDTAFFLRQWNVDDLMGKSVVFEAVGNGFGGPAGLNWFGFYGLGQVTTEFMTVTAQLGGNEFYGSNANWDAHNRDYGATLVSNMQGVFDNQPDFALMQQWNEFGAPDQYGVEQSSDMEPTVNDNRAGVHSDGWGYYYLNLTTELISQYRSGAAFPAVQLDTSYP